MPFILKIFRVGRHGLAKAKLKKLKRTSPAADRASAAANMVAPVVTTSSTKRMCLPLTCSGRRRENCPSTFSRRANRLICWV